MGRRVKLQFPCGTCRAECEETDCIYCEALPMKNSMHLRSIVEGEMLLSPAYVAVPDDACVSPRFVIDQTAATLLDTYNLGLEGDPIRTTGNGNCLFNAASLVLYGNESRSTELRYYTCLMMLLKQERYMLHERRRDIQMLSSSFEKSCFDCATPGGWSSPWTVMGLSDVIRRPIRIIYPPFNGAEDLAHKALNTVFNPTVELTPGCSKISIIWYRLGTLPSVGRYYGVNHFAAVINVGSKTKESDTKFQMPTQKQTQYPRHKEFIDDSISTRNMFEALPVESHEETDDEMEDQFGAHPVEAEEDTDDEIEDPLNSSVGSVQSDASDQDLAHRAPATEPSFQPGPLKKFLEIDAITDILQQPYTALPEIPTGRKDGNYFIVDNAKNNGRRRKGLPSEHWDDCGAWNKAASPVTYFVEKNGKRVLIFKHGGKFCTAIKTQGKRQYAPMDPQPTGDELLSVHRLYQALKASPKDKDTFKRRITWFEKADQTFPEVKNSVAFVEYVGVFPNRQFHGGVKNEAKNVKFIRCKPVVNAHLKQELKEKGVKQVQHSLNKQTTSDFEKHRNEKHLRNIKHTANKQQKDASETGNLADQIIHVEELTRTGDYVHDVAHNSYNKKPTVILFKKQQIIDIRRFCVKGGAVLGMDKTFNLGDFFVTPTVFKDLSVVRRSTQEHPICFGPIYIHTNSTIKTYSTFLHKIADNLEEHEVPQLIIGTDEEVAMKTAIRRCFIGATHVLCTRHLKQNLNKYMEDSVGYPLKDRLEISEKVFGTAGLTENTDNDTLDYRLKQIEESIEEKDARCGDKKLLPYFTKKLYPLLQQHVIEPVKRGKVPRNWTNNNSESANHVLKTATKWKLTELATFIQKLRDIIVSEHEERCRAVRDMGNYALADSFRHHLTNIDSWGSMSQEQKKTRLEKFHNDTGRKDPNVLTSKDGTRTAIRTPMAGKKPHQRRRKRSERSRTPSKTPSKRRLVIESTRL